MSVVVTSSSGGPTRSAVGLALAKIAKEATFAGHILARDEKHAMALKAVVEGLRFDGKPTVIFEFPEHNRICFSIGNGISVSIEWETSVVDLRDAA